jgi:hypothetical protein
MADLQGRPAHVEQRWEDYIVRQLSASLLGIAEPLAVVLEGGQKRTDHEYQSTHVPGFSLSYIHLI